MRHMSSELHFKSCNTKVAQLSIVQYKVCIIQLDHIHGVVQNHRVGSLHKPKQIIFWMSLVWLLNESKLQNTRLRSKLLLGMVQLKFMIFIMYQNLNQSEWLMNDYWITIEWQLNDYWMTTELLLNDYWMTTEWLLNDMNRLKDSSNSWITIKNKNLSHYPWTLFVCVKAIFVMS